MLRDARMAAMRKLRRGINLTDGCLLWAGLVVKGDHSLQFCRVCFLRFADIFIYRERMAILYFVF